MATILKTRLSRELEAYLTVDKISRGRRIIVELAAPDLISFRWKGTRRRYSAPVSKLMQWVIQATVEAERRARKAARKEKTRGSLCSINF